MSVVQFAAPTGSLPPRVRVPRSAVLRSATTSGRIEIAQALVDGELTRTMDGASTLVLTLHDPHRKLIRAPMLVRGPGQLGYVDMKFTGIWWRMVKVEKTGDDVTLTFEDRAVAHLRAHSGPKKATRGKVTRAEFARSLVAEVKEGGGIGWYSPDEHKVQPVEIKKKRDKKKKADKPVEYAKGVPLNRQDLKIRHADGSLSSATPGNIRLADRLLDVAYSIKNVPPKAVTALIEAGMIESGMANLEGGDRDSRGVLQVRDGTAAGMKINNRDPEQCAHAFLTRGFWTSPSLGGGGAIAIARRHPNASAGQIAQACQGSAHPDRYDRAQAEANAMIQTYDPGLVDVNWSPGGGGGGGSSSKTVTEPFQFRRGGTDGEPENSWDCLQRLASEVAWRCFVDRDRVVFASDPTLMSAQPILTIRESDPAVSSVDFDIDRGKQNLAATLVIRAPLWVAGPGKVIELLGCGPANGRWLIETIRHPVHDLRTEITLTAAGEAEPEPAPTEKTVTTDGPDEAPWALAGRPALDAPGRQGQAGALGLPHAPEDHRGRGTADRAQVRHDQRDQREAVAAANATHGMTVDSRRSDHQGPGHLAWAVDMSNGQSPTSADGQARRRARQEVRDALGRLRDDGRHQGRPPLPDALPHLHRRQPLQPRPLRDQEHERCRRREEVGPMSFSRERAAAQRAGQDDARRRSPRPPPRPGDELYVTIDSFDGGASLWGPCRWSPGTALPRGATRCWSSSTSTEQPWVDHRRARRGAGPGERRPQLRAHAELALLELDGHARPGQVPGRRGRRHRRERRHPQRALPGRNSVQLTFGSPTSGKAVFN